MIMEVHEKCEMQSDKLCLLLVYYQTHQLLVRQNFSVQVSQALEGNFTVH